MLETEAQEIIKVINSYSNALNLLDDYDHKKLPNQVKLKIIKKFSMRIFFAYCKYGKTFL